MSHISVAVRNDCWNTWQAYGGICVHCGCCSSNPKTRDTARLAVLKSELERVKNFEDWADDPEIREIQERNNAISIGYWEKEIAELEAKLNGLD